MSDIAHYRRSDEQVRLEVTPESAGWRFLTFAVVAPGAGYRVHEHDREVAIVPLSGSGRAVVDGQEVALSRASVFTEMPRVLYVPPGHEIELAGDDEA